MTRNRILKRAIPFLVCIGLSLSACVGRPGGYGYGLYDFDYGGWGGWHHGWDHSHWDHDGGDHGFAHGGEGEHGGGGEHGGFGGGGGHGGGGGGHR